MRGFLTLLSALLTYTTAVYTTALTYRLEAHEKACFFAKTENKGTKLAFYFAVRPSLHAGCTFISLSLVQFRTRVVHHAAAAIPE